MEVVSATNRCSGGTVDGAVGLTSETCGREVSESTVCAPR